jgi:recombination protein RecT
MTNQISTKDFFNSPAVEKKFQDVLGKNSKAFVNSIISITSDNKLLMNADPQSIMKAAMKAATLNLAIEPSLGFAYVVPYGREAQFQLGYKGLIQLAIRSGQIKNINSGVIYTSQFNGYDPLFEKLDVDFSKPAGDEIAGYFATIELVNGFKKLIYWDYAKVYAHGKRFSKSFSKGPWKTDFDAMAQKTLLKELISKYAPLSQEMQDAVKFDNEGEDSKEAPIDVTEEPETLEDLINADPETGEIIENPEQLDLGVSYEDPNTK